MNGSQKRVHGIIPQERPLPGPDRSRAHPALPVGPGRMSPPATGPSAQKYRGIVNQPSSKNKGR